MHFGLSYTRAASFIRNPAAASDAGGHNLGDYCHYHSSQSQRAQKCSKVQHSLIQKLCTLLYFAVLLGALVKALSALPSLRIYHINHTSIPLPQKQPSALPYQIKTYRSSNPKYTFAGLLVFSYTTLLGIRLIWTRPGSQSS